MLLKKTPKNTMFQYGFSHGLTSLVISLVQSKNIKELLFEISYSSRDSIYYTNRKMLLLHVCILSNQPKFEELSEIIIVHISTFLYPVKDKHCMV